MQALKLEELKVYNKAIKIGEWVWEIVGDWNYFAKDTVGKQWVRSADSIAANISEGYGRYHFKENKKFCYYSRGSLKETQTWLEKAHQRKLVSAARYDFLKDHLQQTHKMLNSYIRSIGNDSKKK
ncbi:MAG: four helix bundle protein [Bacteroidota bacterium]